MEYIVNFDIVYNIEQNHTKIKIERVERINFCPVDSVGTYH